MLFPKLGFSNDFGQTYSSFEALSGTDGIPIFRTYSDNLGTDDKFYSIWEDPQLPGDPKFLSHLQDFGETFDYESLIGRTGSSSVITLEAGITYTTDETSIPSDFTLTGSDCTVNGTLVGTTFTPADLDIVLCTFTNTFS